MSLFRKPKKTIQRRVFTENDDDDDKEMIIQQNEIHTIDKDVKKKDKSKQKNKQTLLSFETEEEGEEVFQVKKSSQSKKVMRMFEKERQKRKENKKIETKDKEERTEIVTDDLILVVNPSHKKSTETPPPPPPPPILNGRAALCAGKDDLSSDEDDDNTTIHRFSKPDNFKKVLESGAIPDAAMIHAAKKKRQRAREMGDVIPLEEEEIEDKGRLLREDDNEGSDDERIDMDVNVNLRDQERRREQFLAASQDSDQEINEWEDQQIRKGVTGAPSTFTHDLFYPEQHTTDSSLTIVPTIDPGVPRTPQMIASKLREHYQSIRESHEKHQANFEKIHNDIDRLDVELIELKSKAPIAAERFKFYQELRGYITDLVECFDEKISTIANLEQRAMDLLAKKYEWLIERRRQDVRDQAEEVTNKTMQPKDEEKTRRAAEREGRRTRRRRAREVSGQPKHVEGMSSDEEIPQQDVLNFEKERKQIEDDVIEVFHDVIDDYTSVANILIRFEQWRETDLKAYNEAYATLCLPKIVSPLIRLNLIFWDPLNDNSLDVEKSEWYRTLALYGLHDDETEQTLLQDPDLNLLPTIVEKIIVPKLTQLVDRCWDPVSNSQTLRLIGTISRYIRKFPTLGPGSKALTNLFNAIMHKMKCSLEYDVFIPITPKLIENKSPFFQRQFASGLKLLKNITSWQGIINDATLKELALKSLLNRYLLTAVKFCTVLDGVAKVSLISLVLPRIWLQSDTIELTTFQNTIVNLMQKLDKNNPLHLESIEILSNLLKTIKTQ